MYENPINKNPINRFIFEDNCKQRSINYPGLVDAIYILFFNDRTFSSRANDVLMVLKGLKATNGNMLYSNNQWHRTLDADMMEKVDGYEEKMPSEGCAHLSWNGGDWGPATSALRIPINVEKSSFSCKSQGEHKGHTYISELNVVLQERSSQVSELFHALLNTGFKLGVLFRDANGDARIIADPYYDMKLETSDESGEGPTGTAAASIKFSQTSKLPPIYFKGQLYNGNSYGTTGVAGYKYDGVQDYNTLEEPKE